MISAFLLFLNLSVTAGWMVLAVLLLRFCLKKAPRWITCVLWGLVALRLVVPLTIESPVSLIPTAQTIVSSNEEDENTPPVVNSGVESIDKPLNDWLQTPVDPPTNPPVQSPAPPVSEEVVPPISVPDRPPEDADPAPQPPDEEKPDNSEEKPEETDAKSVSRMDRILNVAAPVWLVGIGLMLLYELLSVLRVRSRVLDAVRLRDNVWQSDRVASPFIFGLFRPRIYVPYGLAEPVLEQVLSHERAHLHRRDHWIKPFAFTLLAVYWYNPLLWVGYILLCRDIEVACDERVVRGLDEDARRQYATALLQCGVERRSIAACPLAFGEVSIKQRIKSVLNYRKPLLWVIIVSLVACAVAAVCLLTVPKSKPDDSKPKDSTTEVEEPIVVLSSTSITPDGHRKYFGTDTDGCIAEGGPDWMWDHAENSDDRKGEADIPLVLTETKAEYDEFMGVLDDPYQSGMHRWFDINKYDEAYFEEKAIVWLYIPGYNLGSYDYTVALEETNKGLRYAVTLEYVSTSIFDPWPEHCEYLLLFETDRKVIEQADSLSTRHEKAPIQLPTEEENLSMLSVGNADLNGDGEAEDIRIYYSDDAFGSGWYSGYAHMVVCKKDGTPILRESLFYQYHSQCYLVPQEDGSSLLLFVEADERGTYYANESFGVLSLNDDERTVLADRNDGRVVEYLNLGGIITYVQSLSGYMDNAQLLYERVDGTLYYGDELDDIPQYQPLCWFEEYRENEEDTLNDVCENILASFGVEDMATVSIDLNHDGESEAVSVVRYNSRFGVVLRKADNSILNAFRIYTYLDAADLDHNLYFYLLKDDDGKEQVYIVEPYGNGGYSVEKVTAEGIENIDTMTLSEWMTYMSDTDAHMIFYIRGLDLYYPDEEKEDGDYLSPDASMYMIENYNASITAYNAFLKGQRVACEYGALDTTFYVSDMYATVNDKGIKRYALADVTGDGVPELITGGYGWNLFTYQSGRLLRIYENPPGLYPTRLLSNGCLWEERLGGGNYYRYTKFFEIGTTRTVEFGDPGYDTDEDKYHVDGVWMNKADFDAKTATYFAAAQSPALILWYNYVTKLPDSPAMVQYLSLLENNYNNRNDTYFAVYDTDEDGTEEFLVKVGDEVIVGLPHSDFAAPNEQEIEWKSFYENQNAMLDVTKDGYADFMFVTEESARGKTLMFFRWDTKNERLVKIPTELLNPAVDVEGDRSVIRTSSSGDQIVSYSMWGYDENQEDFVCTHSLYFEENEQSSGDSDNMKLVVEENGVEKTLYVRGELYALDKTDPQVAPYYVSGSLWDLDGLKWEMYLLTKVQNGNYGSYANLLRGKYLDQDIEYALRDLNADGQKELLVLEYGTTLTVYTMKSGYTQLMMKQEFFSGTSRFLDAGDVNYPGIIYFCVGGGRDRYYYLTLDNVKDEEFVLIPLWTDNYGFYEEGEDGRITELNDDKKLIELSREAYEQNRDIFADVVIEYEQMV